jgi:hypothetical protein
MFIVDGSMHSLVSRHDYAFIEALSIPLSEPRGTEPALATDTPNRHAGRLQFFRYHAISLHAR